jgi:hypothetical protein
MQSTPEVVRAFWNCHMIPQLVMEPALMAMMARSRMIRLMVVPLVVNNLSKELLSKRLVSLQIQMNLLLVILNH